MTPTVSQYQLVRWFLGYTMTCTSLRASANRITLKASTVVCTLNRMPCCFPGSVLLWPVHRIKCLRAFIANKLHTDNERRSWNEGKTKSAAPPRLVSIIKYLWYQQGRLQGPKKKKAWPLGNVVVSSSFHTAHTVTATKPFIMTVYSYQAVPANISHGPFILTA